MEVIKERKGNKLEIALVGKLDTVTTPEAEKEIMGELEGVEELIFDFKDLEYISSSGLRLLLSLQKTMNTQGSMTIINVNQFVQEIFEMTGFEDILNIK